VAIKAENEETLKDTKKGFRSAILVRQRNHAAGSEQDGDRVDGGRADASRLSDTFVFGDQLAIAPGITDTLCYPYSFASASPSQDCPPYRLQELLERLLSWVASESIQGADEASIVGNVAVVTPRELPPEMEESIATAPAKGFGFDSERIRIHFMNETPPAAADRRPASFAPLRWLSLYLSLRLLPLSHLCDDQAPAQCSPRTSSSPP
jgi:hypothetical protein